MKKIYILLIFILCLSNVYGYTIDPLLPVNNFSTRLNNSVNVMDNNWSSYAVVDLGEREYYYRGLYMFEYYDSYPTTRILNYVNLTIKYGNGSNTNFSYQITSDNIRNNPPYVDNYFQLAIWASNGSLLPNGSYVDPSLGQYFINIDLSNGTGPAFLDTYLNYTGTEGRLYEIYMVADFTDVPVIADTQNPSCNGTRALIFSALGLIGLSILVFFGFLLSKMESVSIMVVAVMIGVALVVMVGFVIIYNVSVVTCVV